MARSAGTFGKGQNSIRGRSKRTLILEAMREEALLGVAEGASSEDVEKAWFKHLASIATDTASNNAGLCLKLLTERGWAALKASSELVEFEFDETASPTEKAGQVLAAVADGRIPLEYGVQLVSAIKSTVEIELNTEIKKRLEDIEKKLGVNN